MHCVDLYRNDVRVYVYNVYNYYVNEHYAPLRFPCVNSCRSSVSESPWNDLHSTTTTTTLKLFIVVKSSLTTISSLGCVFDFYFQLSHFTRVCTKNCTCVLLVLYFSSLEGSTDIRSRKSKGFITRV